MESQGRVGSKSESKKRLVIKREEWKPLRLEISTTHSQARKRKSPSNSKKRTEKTRGQSQERKKSEQQICWRRRIFHTSGES